MHTGVAEVAVERAFIVVVLHELAQVAKIGAKFLGRDGGIFEAFPAQGLIGNVGGDPEARFANVPDAAGLARVGEHPHVGRGRGTVQRLHQVTSLRLSLRDGVSAELDHQPARTFGKERQALKIKALAAAGIDDDVVETFEANGAVRHDLWNKISTDVDIRPSDHYQHTGWRAFDEAAGRFEDGHAGALGTNERARNMEAAFREQMVEVVSGNAARDIGELAANVVAIAIGELLETGVDLGAAATFALDAGEIFLAGSADVQALAIVGKDFERLDVVVGFTGHDRVHAAGIVADHTAESATVVSGGIGREGEVMLFGGGAEVIEDDAGFDASDAALRVNLEDPGHVLGEVENDGRVAALSGERRAAAAGEQRGLMFAAKSDGGENIFFVSRNDDADGNLAIIRAIGCIECAAAGVEADFTAKMPAESGFELRRIEVGGTRRGRGYILRHRTTIFEDRGAWRKDDFREAHATGLEGSQPTRTRMSAPHDQRQERVR